MKFTIALIGRRNVGKSTLFNRITATRDALIDKLPGFTRDRQYGYLKNNYNIRIVDTGGIVNNISKLDVKIFNQTLKAIQEANLILFIVNCRDGIMPEDLKIAKILRVNQKQTIVVTNKIDAIQFDYVNFEFYSLGFKKVHAISALYGNGVESLFKRHVYAVREYNILKSSNVKTIITDVKKKKKYSYIKNDSSIKIAIIGKPNVGKSTLINSYIKSERLITHSMPGTTRDSIWVPVQDHKKNFIFIDTAGLKKINGMKKIHCAHHDIDSISTNKTFQNIKYANIVLIVIDAKKNISNQDLSLCNFIIKSGKSIIIVINKCDLLTKQEKNSLQEHIKLKLRFAKFITLHFISAKYKIGIKSIIQTIYKIYQSSIRSFSTSELTKIMFSAVINQQPPMINGKKIKLKYAHPGGVQPLRIIIHGTKTEYIKKNYKKYLQNYFQSILKISGTPILLNFKNNLKTNLHK